jgi:hypothetical protein
MTIRSFKGRRDVEVHLFRSSWESNEEKELNWPTLIEGNAPQDSSKTVVMESFTTQERDRIVNYLKEQYSTRLTAIKSTPLTFPVPAGLPGLSQVAVGKTIGIIEFDQIPSYSLGLPIKGMYDLSQHPPIAEE